jgi:hypothetical protein
VRVAFVGLDAADDVRPAARRCVITGVQADMENTSQMLTEGNTFSKYF